MNAAIVALVAAFAGPPVDAPIPPVRNASCVEGGQSTGLLPQPLGILPTRQFWQDEENQRRGCLPFLVFAVLLSVLIAALDPPWWAAVLMFPAMLVLMKGLSERYVRQADKRHIRSRPGDAALDESSNPPDSAG